MIQASGFFPLPHFHLGFACEPNVSLRFDFCSDRIRNSGNIRLRRLSTFGGWSIARSWQVVAAAIEATFETKVRWLVRCREKVTDFVKLLRLLQLKPFTPIDGK